MLAHSVVTGDWLHLVEMTGDGFELGTHLGQHHLNGILVPWVPGISGSNARVPLKAEEVGRGRNRSWKILVGFSSGRRQPQRARRHGAAERNKSAPRCPTSLSSSFAPFWEKNLVFLVARQLRI